MIIINEENNEKLRQNNENYNNNINDKFNGNQMEILEDQKSSLWFEVKNKLFEYYAILWNKPDEVNKFVEEFSGFF